MGENEEGLFFQESRSRPIDSKMIENPAIQKQITTLKRVIDEAQGKIDYDKANDEELQKAIRIVEQFLERSGRVCYGGQAINAHLSPSLKFYDEEMDLPDYDFFTPNSAKDVKNILELLQENGFTEVHEKAGIHEGTRKILINFVAVADITQIDSELYKRIHRDSVIVSNIRYASPDFLRMMMYLELSRPRGQVERWEKVYERLLLLNESQPMDRCDQKTRGELKIKNIDPSIRRDILEYIIDKGRVFAGAELGFAYRSAKRSMKWILGSGGPIIFYSPDIISDTQAVLESIGVEESYVDVKEGMKDILPLRVVVRKKNIVVAYIVEETACHAYNEMPIKGSKVLRVASMDSLIHMYMGLGLLTDDFNVNDFKMPILCLAQRFVEIIGKVRASGGNTWFPKFTITCSGHQTSFTSLLRAKLSRVAKEKEKAVGSKKIPSSITRKKKSASASAKKNEFSEI